MFADDGIKIIMRSQGFHIFQNEKLIQDDIQALKFYTHLVLLIDIDKKDASSTYW